MEISPSSSGATRPLIDEPRYAEYIHGSDGLGDLRYACFLLAHLDPRPAVELLRDLSRRRSMSPVTLLFR
jgi:inosine-uridine nucleoside N-ribohydrolase